MDDADRIQALSGQRPARLQALGGGDIARSLQVHWADGNRAMVKFARPGQPSMQLEARMLDDLRRAGLPVPDTLAAADDALLLAWVEAGHHGWDDTVQRAAGRAIATLHQQPVAAGFGYAYDTVIGSLAQANPRTGEWSNFFGQHRLRARAASAHASGQLPVALRQRIDALTERLERWLDPATPPSLVHGDLWGGNMLPVADGSACFIDPAIYHGDAEVDLAMATLFNSVGPAFFDGYRQVRPIADGFFQHRCTLYQLYPLLVHVELFGAPYVAGVERALTTLHA